ncbi:MAG TPA: carboxypeptidase regulatory-like domain-containing protein [Gemmatimonadaceae bacterium]|nr:carboxypeptidase regulatory-like domain-containing protein [Gemmatimonadaceae bacterium]
MPRAVATFVLAPLVALAACARDEAAATDGRAPGLTAGVGRGRYEVVDVGNGGAVIGTVRLAGDAPPDTTIAPTTDPGVCGDRIVRPVLASDGVGSGLGEAVVWLADARRGKALPLERRYELRNARCDLEPRVQAVVAGGTINVRSADAAVHRNRFRRPGAGRTLALVQLNDEGQVVPDEQVLAAPGAVEVTCDQHPWTRAWIAAFDHPYFAVTGRDGRFRIDGVPPGEYRLRVWHPRVGVREERVRVTPGGEERVEVGLTP